MHVNSCLSNMLQGTAQYKSVNIVRWRCCLRAILTFVHKRDIMWLHLRLPSAVHVVVGMTTVTRCHRSAKHSRRPIIHRIRFVNETCREDAVAIFSSALVYRQLREVSLINKRTTYYLDSTRSSTSGQRGKQPGRDRRSRATTLYTFDLLVASLRASLESSICIASAAETAAAANFMAADR